MPTFLTPPETLKLSEAALLTQRLDALRRDSVQAPLPLPAQGATAERHHRLYAAGQLDLSFAKLAEAHWDALAILAEAGRAPVPGALYAVWASEVPGQPLHLAHGRLSGKKAFCSGAGLVDRALITIGADDGRLLDVDLHAPGIASDTTQWQTEAFRVTRTGAVTFHDVPVSPDAVVGPPGFYLARPGFWHGACGPAAVWAGGVAGLLPYAQSSRRDDPHTLAHLAAMQANDWALRALLQAAGHEIDAQPDDVPAAQARALTLRHLVEQLAADTLHRFARAYGPHPLAMHAPTARRYAEADLFLRQSHGERDLESLARLLREHPAAPANAPL